MSAPSRATPPRGASASACALDAARDVRHRAGQRRPRRHGRFVAAPSSDTARDLSCDVGQPRPSPHDVRLVVGACAFDTARDLRHRAGYRRPRRHGVRLLAAPSPPSTRSAICAAAPGNAAAALRRPTPSLPRPSTPPAICATVPGSEAVAAPCRRPGGNGEVVLGEALVLGFSSGPVCLASCGPVLLPWLAAEGRRVSGTAALVAGFLGGRLAGYLLFAAAAWTLGAAAAPSPRIRAIVFGAAHVGIAAVLLAYAPRPRTCADGCGLSRPRRPAAGSVALGLLTGVNLCAPFLAAAVRASESPGPGGALLFFSAYFAGTSLWFLPAVGAGWLARLEGAARAARYAMALLALYYGYRGLITLFGGALHA